MTPRTVARFRTIKIGKLLKVPTSTLRAKLHLGELPEQRNPA